MRKTEKAKVNDNGVMVINQKIWNEEMAVVINEASISNEMSENEAWNVSI